MADGVDVSFECHECKNAINVKDRVLKCGGFCDKSFHIKCVLVKEFDKIKQLKSKVHWFCEVCCLRLEGLSVLPVSFDVNLVKQIEQLFPIVQKLVTNNNDLNIRLSKVVDFNSKLCSMFDLGLGLESWESVGPSSNSKAKACFQVKDVDFPPLKNRFEVLSVVNDSEIDSSSISERVNAEPKTRLNGGRTLNINNESVVANNNRPKSYV